MGATFKFPSVFDGIAFQLPKGSMTDEQFYQFCLLNHEYRIERANQLIILMPSTNSETGNRNAELIIELGIWNRKAKAGFVFDSSTGFKLPSGTDRSPDAAWIQRARWESLPEENRKRFAHIAPDFVAEIRSGEQSLSVLKDKMEEYIESGCQLGWLIDPENKKTMVYSSNGDIQTIPFDTPVNGGSVLPGLSVKMDLIFG